MLRIRLRLRWDLRLRQELDPLACPAGEVAQELKRGIEVAAVRCHYQIDRGIAPAITDTAVAKVADTGGHDLEIGIALVVGTPGRGRPPGCHRYVAATHGPALEQRQCRHPAIQMCEREIIESAVWSVSVGIEIRFAGGAVATVAARRIRAPAERHQHGVDVADNVRRDQWQVFGVVMLKPYALPAVGLLRLGMQISAATRSAAQDQSGRRSACHRCSSFVTL